MRGRRRDLTVIFAGPGGTTARKYLFSSQLMIILGIILLVLVSSFALSALHYYYMWNKTSEHTRLKEEADQLRRENETFRLTANQLTEKISALEVTSKKLTIVSGLDQKGLGGVGGPASNDLPGFSLSNRDLFRYFKSLGRKSISLETELSRLREHYTTQSILWAATPTIIPVHGYPSATFGYRRDPFNGKRDFHPGVDISAPWGNKVIAPADGLVLSAGRWLGYGKLIILRHKFGITTRYGHLGRIAVKAGQEVQKGDIIGYVGSTGRATGPHLHYEVRLNNRPLNPLRFFRD